ncbi:MAG: hypothetical protein ABIS50_09365 [Luteolibacter sp.]|uniref:hypothetical protein n=1 Tax=Luteolibacter sp. TaxID=1962973 RepID=UPI0032651B0F
MNEHPARILARGYINHCDWNCEPNDMFVETNFSEPSELTGNSEPVVHIRIGVIPTERPIKCLVEHSATLSIEQARALAMWLLSEAREAESFGS